MRPCRALLSQVADGAVKPSSVHFPRHSDVLTLLHKSSTLLPRILPACAKPSLQSLEFWSDILRTTYTDLTSLSQRPIRIVVQSYDEYSPSKELLSALLLDPFASDSVNESVKNRWSNTSDKVLSYGTNSTVPIQSSFLHRFSLPIEVQESCATSPPASLSNVKRMLCADLPILVYNPITSPLTKFPAELAYHSSFLLVIAPESHRYPLPLILPNTSRILFADPHRALEALEILTSDHNSAVAIQRYQDGFVGSNILDVLKSLDETLRKDSQDPRENLFGSFQRGTALTQISSALQACSRSISMAKEEIEFVAGKTSDLSGLVERESEQLHRDVFGNSLEQILKALDQADADMSAVMDKLSWWRVVRQVDEVGFVVTTGVERSWCHELEKQLIWHSSRLSTIQERLSNETFSLLDATRPNPSFPSELLRNSLEQVKASSTYSISPNSLTHPIRLRRTQIIEYPTMSLHAAAQQLVVNTAGSFGAGVGVCWAGWVGWLTGEGLLSIEPSTAMGLGIFGALGFVRLAVGRWEKAKRKWWKDWKRVQGGLERDLSSRLEHVFRQSLVAIPRIACDDLLRMVEKRKEEVADVEEDLDKLTGELKQLQKNET